MSYVNEFPQEVIEQVADGRRKLSHAQTRRLAKKLLNYRKRLLEMGDKLDRALRENPVETVENVANLD